jgi:hypothetical protein
LFFAVYALLFADTGLSLAQISSLFVIWSVVSMALEIPSGGWADVYSRRRLLALAAVIRGVGFLLWTVSPSYWAFALGFVLWGIRSALSSGTRDALLYDELAAVGAVDRYVLVSGRAATAALCSMFAAIGLASPALALGGYPLVGALSVLACLGSALCALSFPGRPRVSTSDGLGWSGYVGMLRSGLAEARDHPGVRRAAWFAAAAPGFTALDEYLPLLARGTGAPSWAVPLLYLLPAAGMAMAGVVAGRLAGLAPRRLAGLLAAAAGVLALGALWHVPAAFLLIGVSFGVLQLGIVLSNAWLQNAITGPARATVLSVANAGAEVCAVLVFGAYALGALWFSTPLLVAAFAVPLLLVARLAGTVAVSYPTTRMGA